MRNRFVSALVLLCIAGCTALAVHSLDERYGQAEVRDRVAAPNDPQSFESTAQPIFNRRCLVCHACYDAPCQLKMETFAGIDRGATTAEVYDSARLLEAPLTRLGIDAQTTAQWRDKGFFPVLNERNQTPTNDLEASVLYRMLALKANNPLPRGVLPSDVFDFSTSRTQTCPALETMGTFEQEHPQWGMPFGLPALSAPEVATVKEWLASGAKAKVIPPLAPAYAEQVERWEAFLNDDAPKSQLMSRYVYEHLFLGDLYFDEVGTAEHFRLVRSTTMPGQPIDVIATRRPYDDPGVARPYYRLQRNTDTLVSKTHMAYALNAKRMQRWQELFLRPNYVVGELPDYKTADASNPFVTFRVIPVKSRYQFMIDEAQFTIMGFIKGPVCRGQIALNVIEDQFWVWFIDPEVEAATHDGEFLAKEVKNLTLPASLGSDNLRLLQWVRYSDLEKQWLEAKAKHDRETYPNGRKLTLDIIWNGDGVDSNAALTIFRHFDSATVVRGLVGPEPKTAWVIDYPLLERIHYLLVAGYDVYGNAGLQLFSRLYMDFLRIGGEFNFLYFLPPEARTAAVHDWYRGADKTIAKYLDDYQVLFDQATGIAYTGGDPQHELYVHLREHIGPALASNYDLDRAKLPDDLAREMQRLATTKGMPVSWLPELSMVRFETSAGWRTLTVVHNDGHSNVATMFDEAERRRPEEDTLSVVPGYLGAYPNAFFKVPRGDAAAFVDAVAALSSEADFGRLVDRFGIRRSDPMFWMFSDTVYDEVDALDYADRGVLDYSRIENR
jgi:hypothetical protein